MKPNLLLVDADLAVRESLGAVLMQAGYGVITASDAAEAACHAGPRRFDLLVLDINLSFKHGWEIFRELVNLAPEAPIIVTTNTSNKYPAALMSGVSALIEKPVDPRLLLKHVDDLLASPGSHSHPNHLGPQDISAPRPIASVEGTSHAFGLSPTYATAP